MKEKESTLSCYRNQEKGVQREFMLRIGVTTQRKNAKFIFQLVICLTTTPGLPEPRQRIGGHGKLVEEAAICPTICHVIDE